MANVMSEVILALWSHLRPAPYPWGGKSLQLLRKLGSRNRRFLKEPLALECKENPEHGLRLILTFEFETSFLETCFKFLRVCLSSQLDLPERATNDGLISRHLSTVLVSLVDRSWRKSKAYDVNGLVPPRFSLLNNNSWSIDLYTQSKESRPDEVAKQKTKESRPDELTNQKPKESFLNFHNESKRIKSDKFSKSRRSKDWKITIIDPDEPPPFRSAMIANIHADDRSYMRRSPSPKPVIQRKRDRSAEGGQIYERGQPDERSQLKIDLGVKTKTQLMAAKSIFKILLMTIIAASAEPDSIDPKDDYVTNIYRHFAIIFHMENSSTNTPILAIFLGVPLLSSNTNNSFKSRNGSSFNLIELDSLLFLDALVEVLADEDRLHAKTALNALNVFCETLSLLGQTCYQVNESYLFANSNGWGYRSWCISGKVTVEKGWIS
nr:nucleotide-binding, alpha-beta plait [Tanacetum cinerariifolium]